LSQGTIFIVSAFNEPEPFADTGTGSLKNNATARNYEPEWRIWV
jgi:hypothetical protein